MNNFKSFIIFLVLFFVLVACNRRNKELKYESAKNDNEFAEYFNIINHADSSVLEIKDSWSTTGMNTYRYILLNEKNKLKSNRRINTISIPVTKVICMSTSHIAYMTVLGLQNKIIGISGKQYVSDNEILKKIERKEILDVGYEGSLNYELLMRLNPDVVFTYGITGENNVYIDKIKDLGIPVIALGDYLEDSPIGKLEYLKLFGKLFNCSQRADSIYISVKERYIHLNQSVINTEYRPKVLLNAPWKDVWFIPGYNNYMSVLIRDAGGDPVLSKQNESKSVPYSFEEVYQVSIKADYWLNPNNYSSINALKESNPLFKNIPSLKNGNVFNNTKRETIQGGSDFWEKGVIEPDVILNDLINIIHPELNSKRELVYYKQLK